MLDIGQLVVLGDNKTYMVLNAMSFHNTRYVFLLDYETKQNMFIAIERIIDDKINLEVIKNKHEINYVISSFVLNS